MTKLHMRTTCWIPKSTNTNSEYVILIAVPLKEWLDERASMLRCTRIAYLVLTLSVFVISRQEAEHRVAIPSVLKLSNTEYSIARRMQIILCILVI
jgi:hypothetical protein